jgi:hypothetical protein
MVEAVVTVTLLIWIHTISSHVRPCPCATQFTEDVLIQSMPNFTCGCVNDHELMMCVCVEVKDVYVVYDKLTVIMLGIWLIALSILLNTTNDPKLITNPNCNAGVDHHHCRWIIF